MNKMNKWIKGSKEGRNKQTKERKEWENQKKPRKILHWNPQLMCSSAVLLHSNLQHNEMLMMSQQFLIPMAKCQIQPLIKSIILFFPVLKPNFKLSFGTAKNAKCKITTMSLTLIKINVSLKPEKQEEEFYSRHGICAGTM